MSPSKSTLKFLFARTGNRCPFPKCSTPLTLDDKLLGEVCHIRGDRPGSPRHDPNQSEDDRHAYGNLIVMCPTHHTVIDDDEEAYTVVRLHKMKSEQEASTALMADDKAERLAENYFSANISNIGQMGGIAAQNIHTANFTVNHHSPVDPFSNQRTAQAVESLWKTIKAIGNEFRALVFIDQVLTPEEIQQGYAQGWNSWNPKLGYLNQFSEYDSAQKLLSAAGAFEADVQQPFVSNETWAAFSAIRQTYGRYGFLMGQSIRNRRAEPWQHDRLIDPSLRSVLSPAIVEKVKQQRMGGFTAAINYLEQEFMAQAGFRPK